MSAIVSIGLASSAGTAARRPSRTANVPAAKPVRSMDCAKIVNASWPDGSTMTRSDTGCTTEAQQFRDLHAKFRRAGAQVFGISRDSLTSHAKFRVAQELPFHLLSDSDEEVCKLFDVIREKSLYGRKYMGIERSTFLIDESGKLRREWRKVKVAGHAQEVLDSLRATD